MDLTYKIINNVSQFNNNIAFNNTDPFGLLSLFPGPRILFKDQSSGMLSNKLFKNYQNKSGISQQKIRNSIYTHYRAISNIYSRVYGIYKCNFFKHPIMMLPEPNLPVFDRFNYSDSNVYSTWLRIPTNYSSDKSKNERKLQFGPG